MPWGCEYTGFLSKGGPSFSGERKGSCGYGCQERWAGAERMGGGGENCHITSAGKKKQMEAFWCGKGGTRRAEDWRSTLKGKRTDGKVMAPKGPEKENSVLCARGWRELLREKGKKARGGTYDSEEK